MPNVKDKTPSPNRRQRLVSVFIIKLSNYRIITLNYFPFQIVVVCLGDFYLYEFADG
jgi:hypothetical protein